MGQMSLTAVYMKVPVGYAAKSPRRKRTKETLKETRANLEEAVSTVLDANRELSEQSLKGPRSFARR
jgi:hypothetical protein